MTKKQKTTRTFNEGTANDGVARRRGVSAMMAEEAKKSMNDDALRPQTETVGGMLRTAREKRGLALEDVCAAINVRVSQLRAIEDGRIDDLPGMTYALGFVRSYAMHLKLNSADIVQKFKIEHGLGMSSGKALHMPEASRDVPKPDIMVVGAAVFVAALVLVFWAVFSGGEDGDATAHLTTVPAVSDVLGTGAPLLAEMPETPETPALAETAEVLAPVAESAPETGTGAPDAVSPVAEASAPVAEAAPDAEVPVQAVSPVPRLRPEGLADRPVVNVINVKGGKSRITLTAEESTWVEITDDAGNSLLKKVLRPGDQYHVPDIPGLTLKTSNAGGMAVFVDGAEVQRLGRSGEIVRGIDLKPERLKKTRTRASRR